MKIALVGNPNCGKTTLFNALTQHHAKVGNWPGVTIEKKEGMIQNTNIKITDLPGIYSLNAISKDEQITRHYLLNESYDCILNVIDTDRLERSLYLTLQLLEFDCPVILIFNKIDEFKENQVFKIEQAKKILQCPMITLSALKQHHFDELIDLIQSQNLSRNPLKIFDSNVENALLLNQNHHQKHARIQAILTLSKMNHYFDKIAQSYYDFSHYCASFLIEKKNNQITISQKIDHFLLNKYLAFIFFFIVMGLIYYFSIHVIGKISTHFLDNLEQKILNQVNLFFTQQSSHNWLLSLVNKGILTPIFSLLKFIFQIFFLFIGIGILESCGYMSRISFIFDKIFQKFNLSGKSLIPFILGINCSVHGIMACRSLENEKERKMTMILTPYIPCLAKLPMITLFSSHFFAHYAWLVALSFYFLSVIVIFVCAIIINRLYFKIEYTPYLFEMPSYQMPNMKYVINDAFIKTMHFIKKTSTIILASCIVIWFLLSFDFRFNYCSMDRSILAIIGKKISWIFYPIIGKNDWRIVLASLQGIIAKEQVISSLTMMSELSNTNASIFSMFTKSSAYAFICFNLFSIPCINAIMTMKQELNHSKTFIFAIIFQILFAYLFSSFIFLLLNLLKFV